MMSVFMPCTPNPTTGYFFYIPADEVIELPITADEAAKLIMSAGLIQPEGSLAALAADGARRAASLRDETPGGSERARPISAPTSLDAVSGQAMLRRRRCAECRRGPASGRRVSRRGRPSIHGPHGAIAQFDLAELKRRMQAAHATLKHELGGLRTGRASASLLEPVQCRGLRPADAAQSGGVDQRSRAPRALRLGMGQEHGPSGRQGDPGRQPRPQSDDRGHDACASAFPN